jgi:1-deoxy-D-xylulose-5-phosphate reductoisomerase
MLNAANEVAVAGFLAGRLRFPEISELVEKALEDSNSATPRVIGDVLEIDRATRSSVEALMSEGCH